ncbi:hypothetical protein D7B24_001233 [Verticillium nonalfalfae]|uniref:Translation initiation factor 5A-like N-terminal domain-containing protein n=1 Tax=Verticillium nonalfalfae TaxID=1051616 RepID=A0A3M9Y1W6_9PEZI|nr:uncharacterized protein D7B24_001233 [Verticillium nonalfalfae]RNJ53876.1 hypothetical protein D7B24_001233 [Verticillium nonalfalfae]
MSQLSSQKAGDQPPDQPVLRLDSLAATLDFEARVPVPFSIFPSTYKEGETQTTTTTETHQELEIQLPPTQQQPQAPGREEAQQYSSFTATAQLPPRREQQQQQQQQQPQRYTEEVRIEEHFHRPGVQHQETRYHEEHRPQRHDFSESYVEIDRTHQHYDTPLDCIEREYRERCQPHNTREEVNNCDRPGRIINAEYTVEPARTHRPSFRETAREKVKYTVEGAARRIRETKAKMGYYDDDVPLPCFLTVLPWPASPLSFPISTPAELRRDEHVHADNDVRQPSRPRPSGGNQGPCLPNTVSIPCNHIRMGDFLMLQGRPCQVIRISTSAATGQYRYLGVDLFTKQLHEESSYISNPEPSVVVQTMLGPVFKQYRVLDMHDGRIVAMTETGDVKPDLPVIDQSNLWSRLNTAFESGRGSVRVLVLNDRGRELAVDMKTIHGSRL